MNGNLSWFLSGCQLVVGRFDLPVVLRLLLTTVLCGIVGMERSNHERASGLRTHVLVGVGACLITMVGVFGYSGGSGGRDPFLLSSDVVSGIGFLGAGAILRHGTTVRGLTTAATLWGSAGVGIAVGAGQGAMAATAVLLILFTLVPMQRLEMRMRSQRDAGDLTLHLTNDRDAVGKALNALAKLGVSVKRATVTPGIGDTAVLRIDLGQPLRSNRVGPLVKNLLVLKYVTRVDTSDLNPHPEEESPDHDAVGMMEYDVPLEEAEQVPSDSGHLAGPLPADDEAEPDGQGVRP